MPETEEQIAARLRADMVKPEQEETPTVESPEKVEADPDGLHNNLPLDNIQIKYELLNYFGLSPTQYHIAEVQDQLGTIAEWAHSNAEVKDIGGILKAISRQEQSMGNSLRPDRLFRMYNYVKLSRQMTSLQGKMEALYGGA